jgi:hypothetical protein
MGVAVLRHFEGLATGAVDGLCCSSMLPKKMLLQPILSGEAKATDSAEESSVLCPGPSLHNRTHSTQRSLLLDGLQLQPVKRKFFELCTVNIHSIIVVITVLPQVKRIVKSEYFFLLLTLLFNPFLGRKLI